MARGAAMLLTRLQPLVGAHKRARCRAARVWCRARSRVMYACRMLAERLSSRTFLVCVSAPFTGWGLMLYVFDVQHSAELPRIVMDGPSAMFALWFLASSVWGASAAILGRLRHAMTVWLALCVLAVMLERIESAARQSRGPAAPVCMEEQCVALKPASSGSHTWVSRMPRKGVGCKRCEPRASAAAAMF